MASKVGSLAIPSGEVIGLEFDEEMVTLADINTRNGRIRKVIRGVDNESLTTNYEAHTYLRQNDGVYKADLTDYEVLLRHLNYGLENFGLVHID